jgi:Mce-associated membrane protein
MLSVITVKTEKHPDAADEVVGENSDGLADSDDAVEDSVDDVEDSVDDVEDSVDAAEKDDTDADQDESSSEPAENKGGRPRWRRRLRVAGVCLLFLAPVATSAFLGWQLWQKHQVDRAGQEARKAAVAYAQVLTSIDSNKVDENFAQVLDGSTGEFKDMYSKSSMQLRQLLIDNKAAARGVAVESAVQSEAKNKVVVLLFVDQSVSNTNVPDPRLDRSRIKMTMEYVDGRWRASKVELA